MMNTKVMGGKKDGQKILVDVEAVKGGKKETVYFRFFVNFLLRQTSRCALALFLVSKFFIFFCLFYFLTFLCFFCLFYDVRYRSAYRCLFAYCFLVGCRYSFGSNWPTSLHHKLGR